MIVIYDPTVPGPVQTLGWMCQDPSTGTCLPRALAVFVLVFMHSALVSSLLFFLLRNFESLIRSLLYEYLRVRITVDFWFGILYIQAIRSEGEVLLRINSLTWVYFWSLSVSFCVSAFCPETKCFLWLVWTVGRALSEFTLGKRHNIDARMIKIIILP